MQADNLIREIFEKHQTVAVYGMSRNPAKPAHHVPRYLLSKGYHIIPINPAALEIAGLKSYPGLPEIHEPIDILEVFRPSAQVSRIITQALARKKHKGDIAVIWLQKGITDEDARKAAEKDGTLFVQDRCMMTEFQRFFPERQ